MNSDFRSRDKALTKFRLWSRRVGLPRRLALVLAVMAVVSGLATLTTMTGSIPSKGPDTKVVITLLYLDLIFLLALGLLVAHRLARVWVERRKGQAGSSLHIRFVFLFGMLAVTPAIVVAVFAALFLNVGVQGWFSERVRTAIVESQAVANAYLKEHQQTIRADAFAMANDLNRDAAVLARDPAAFSQVLNTHTALRGLSEAVVVDGMGRSLARSSLSFSLELDLVPLSAIEKAARGKIVVLTNESDDRVRAVVKLNRFVDAFLLVGRLVEPSVLDHIDKTERAVAQYKRIEKQHTSFQITFVMIFVVVALLLLLAAVWIGLIVATQMTRPITGLIAAAERVSKGDLEARVNASTFRDEIGTLGRTFNRMAGQLQAQQMGLVEANRELDERRRFTETVLSGVSAGVVGLDEKGRIYLPNRSAEELLETDLKRVAGKPLRDIVPEMASLFDTAQKRPDRIHQAEIKVARQHKTRTLIANIAAERRDRDVIGYVLTFDDVTDLLLAQRKAAWADVARRIAHEIKNPLTPIQLSAERLERKYIKEIKTDPETFSACTETIIRQVEDIGRMVDEFSSFARMPQASLKFENLSKICRQAVFLERNRHTEITFETIFPPQDVHLRCDNRQLGQALTNILKNAAESVNGRREEESVPAPGVIRLAIKDDGDQTAVIVTDDGRGLPRNERDRLTEPYVTTHKKGTGLGLAIVKKIMEDHAGDLVLEDCVDGGAKVSLIFYRGALADPIDSEENENRKVKDPMSIAASAVESGS